MNQSQLVLALFDHNLIKFGEVTLKSGEVTYIYADMRAAISYPVLFKDICDKFSDKIKSLKYDFICGVPYSALTFASAIAYAKAIPMLLKRKEAKEYGLKKILEGEFIPGQTCVLIEDVITTGSSILETIEVLNEHELKVTDICILIDRHQGGKKRLQGLGYKVHSIMNIVNVIDILHDNKRIDDTEKFKALSCLKQME
ncbi:MAG: orotate phosphoribosyltransferase [Proteobacteria bacterium]|jgi:uridine monophosphate synthetase|nr:orotate phosphoribosyltransferase [Pseudomonadota bacterium]